MLKYSYPICTKDILQLRISFLKIIICCRFISVVKLLTASINQIRIRTYNQVAIDNTIERLFMKTNWKYFLMDQFKINKKEYHSKKFECI